MADVLIRGMEMPIGCFYCPIGAEQYFTGSIRCPLLGKAVGYFDEVKNKRDMNCPLDPLPEGHGRLIDADACHSPEDLNNEPTIVPAEGGTEECSEN